MFGQWLASWGCYTEGEDPATLSGGIAAIKVATRSWLLMRERLAKANGGSGIAVRYCGCSSVGRLFPQVAKLGGEIKTCVSKKRRRARSTLIQVEFQVLKVTIMALIPCNCEGVES